ncbi:MAG: hypothetical protein H7A39_06075 [Chlamydiales bacterium]|nr:hypothetical protein [Chlamydiales bacterium]
MRKYLISILLILTPLAAAEPEHATKRRDIAATIGLFILSAITLGYVASTSHK